MRDTKMLSRLVLCSLFAGAAYAGQSLVLTPSILNTSVNDPTLARNQSWRVEFQMHNWTLPGPTQFGARVFALNGVGTNVYLFPDGRLSIEDDRDAIAQQAPCFVSTLGLTNVLVRYQRNLSTNSFTCEIWNYDGTGYNSQTDTITGTNDWRSSGGTIGGGQPLTLDLAFLRVFTTTVPPGSKPPTTADGGNWTELKFDGNTNDSSGFGHNASVPGVTYVPTPNQIAVAFPKTFGAPPWSNWISLRAGHPSVLDGTASYSLADNSSSVSFLWRQVSGPSTIVWANNTVGTPIINGLIFGTYNFSLQVTDVAGSTAIVDLQVGAVAYDDNGVVLPSDPNQSSIFGPQIAFGQNPWGLADQLQFSMIAQQVPYQAANNDFGWMTTGQGSVRYPFTGVGFSPSGIAGTKLTSNILAADTSIPIADASKLSLTSLPTWILIGTAIGTYEQVRICSTTATTGPAMLTVCFDGRGVSGNANGISSPGSASGWSSGATVGEFRVQGTGTAFSTDPNRPICPAGVPGPTGQIVSTLSNVGSVSLTAGSVTVTGTGTSWTGAMVGDFIRVPATHGGTAFIWWAQVTAVASATSLTVNRPAPTGIDAGPWTVYSITSPLYLSLEFNAPTDGHVARVLSNGMGCESDTAMFAVATHDIPALDGTVQPTSGSVHYSYKVNVFTSAYNGGGQFTNFYGSGCLAPLNFYLRSGYLPALTLAMPNCQNWPRDPQIGDGFAGGDPLVLGGGVVSSMIYMALFPANGVLAWNNVEQFATYLNTQLIAPNAACNALDTRETSYEEAWTSIAANWDTNLTNAATYTGYINSQLTRDQTCRRNASDGYGNVTMGLNANTSEVNSFANSFQFTTASPAMTVSNGSAAVTGTGFTSSMCGGVDQPAVTMTNGSSTFTFTGTLSNQPLIFITDTSVSPPYVGVYSYVTTGAGTAQLGGVWPGGSGTFNAMSSGANSYSIWTSSADTLANNRALEKQWACVFNSSTSLTLNRPWDNTSGSSYHIFSSNVSGFNQQPFFFGIAVNAKRWQSASPNPAVASAAAAFLPGMGAWFNTYGYDSANNKGTFYSAVTASCYPNNVAAAGSFSSVHTDGGCDVSGLGAGAAAQERVNSVEGGSAMIQFYLANPSPSSKAIVDIFYGAIFAYPPYCAASVATTCSDGQFAQPNTMNAFKWPGFYFGMGGFFTSSWPAIRNNLLPLRSRRVEIAVDITNGGSARITVTAPSGMVSTSACSASPCPITVDDRQGRYWYEVQHLSGTGKLIGTDQPVLLPAAPQL